MAGRARMRHADKHKGFWRPRFVISPELVDHLPGEYPAGKPLKGRRWITGKSTGIRTTATGDEAEYAQALIDQFGDEVVYPAIKAARTAIDPAYQPVTVLDMRNHQRWSLYTPAHLASRRILTMPRNTPGLVALDDETYVLDDDDASVAPTANPSMIDVTPATVVLSLDTALADWKAVHNKTYGVWRDQRAEDKAEKAKRLAAEALFAHAGTRDFGAIKTTKLQAWVDSLSDGQAYYYGNDAKALYSALYQKNRFGEGVANPGEKLFIPAKPEGDTRLPLPEKDAARVLEDARRQEPNVRWGQWGAAYTGFITSEMYLAKASEITVIDGVPVWDCRGRKLKSAYRPRVEPLHPALIAEGLLDYAASRGDGMLFDLTPTQASAALNAHIRSLGIKGAQYVHYSWRHDFTSQLDRHPDKVSAALARVLTGHCAPDVHEANYIHKHIHEMYDAVKLIAYPLVDAMPQEAQSAEAA